MNPFWLLSLVSIFVSSLFAVLGAADSSQDKSETYWLFIGTYTQGKSKGIYRAEYDPVTGAISKPVLAAESINPSFLAIHPNGKLLYAVNEISNLQGKRSGGVSAYAIDPATGELKFLNQQPTRGGAPCHLVVDKKGASVLTANYGGGSVCVHPILPDGKLGEVTSFVQHKGKSINKKRQEAPHAHSINLDAANRFAFVADLGLDKVLIYRFDANKGTLTANDPAEVELAPGAGPRHFAFHPGGKHAYVINELASTVTAMTYDADRGELKVVQSVSTLPSNNKKTNHTAEVIVHPSGKFLYASNRGHNSVASFKIDPSSGKLTVIGIQEANIDVPRNFIVDPDGKFLLVGNQGADNIVVFAIDPASGELRETNMITEVPMPVCLRMVEKR